MTSQNCTQISIEISFFCFNSEQQNDEKCGHLLSLNPVHRYCLSFLMSVHLGCFEISLCYSNNIIHQQRTHFSLGLHLEPALHKDLGWLCFLFCFLYFTYYCTHVYAGSAGNMKYLTNPYLKSWNVNNSFLWTKWGCLCLRRYSEVIQELSQDWII